MDKTLKLLPLSNTALTRTAPGGLLQGQIRPRLEPNKSQAHAGVAPLTPFLPGSQKFQPLPDPLGPPPYHYELSTVIPDIEAQVASSGKMMLHVTADTGGIKSPDYQMNVAAAMKGDLMNPANERPQFFYHIGDFVYYNGEIADYYSQFYEPYDHYDAPILGVPGNHDGDPLDASQTSLDGWVRYFMTAVPGVNPESHDAPRVTMSLPNPYFTLNSPLVTIVGMYTNVPEGGSIDSVQQQWLTNELATAPQDKALIVALHHPIYSFDDHHSGSPRMADALQNAINDSRRVPNMVMSGHVHNYQRIERTLIASQQTPFLVIGNGGYYNLHGLNIDTPPAAPQTKSTKPGRHHHKPIVQDPDTGAQLIYGNDTNHGYGILTVTADSISGAVQLVAETSYPALANADTFQYSAKPVFLPTGVTIAL